MRNKETVEQAILYFENQRQQLTNNKSVTMCENGDSNEADTPP
jgi:hypothetical protein